MFWMPKVAPKCVVTFLLFNRFESWKVNLSQRTDVPSCARFSSYVKLSWFTTDVLSIRLWVWKAMEIRKRFFYALCSPYHSVLFSLWCMSTSRGVPVTWRLPCLSYSVEKCDESLSKRKMLVSFSCMTT